MDETQRWSFTGSDFAQPLLDRATFLAAPIAHRGLHDIARGIVENTAPAFEAAATAGFGIECDVRPSRDGRAIVFHDATTDRLVARHGLVAELTEAELRDLTYPGSRNPAHILTLSELLDLVSGRVPIFVEVKSDWRVPDPVFVASLAADLQRYNGAIAVMSFDPAYMAAMKEHAPSIPRGLVAANFTTDDPLAGLIGQIRLADLARLSEVRTARPSFIAYDIRHLPTPETAQARADLGVPVLTWTVRSPDDWQRARLHADAAIFEGALPRDLND